MKKPILEITLSKYNKCNGLKKIELLNEFKDVDIVLDTTDLVEWVDINKFYLTHSDKIKILAYIFLPHEFEPYTNTEIDKIEKLLKDFN